MSTEAMPAAAPSWRETASLVDLADMTIRFLRGEVDETPGHAGPPDPETARISTDLVALNRAGVVTVCSQPGLAPVVGWDGALWEQRAFVDGYTDPATAVRVAAACRAAGLLCQDLAVSSLREHRRGWPRPWRRRSVVAYEPVTLRGGETVTSIPSRLPRSQVGLDWGGVGAGAWAEIQHAVHVVVIDPVWHRERYLWETLAVAVRV